MAETGVLSPTDHTELINGYLVEMTAQNAPHRAVIVEGTKLFVDLLRDTAYSVQVQATLPLDCHNVPEPDFAIFRGEGADLLNDEPDDIPLIIEVSDTTLAYDRTDKLACYASNDIPEYWIVNLQHRTLECYRGPDGDEYRERRTLDPPDTVSPQFDDTLSIVVETVLPAPSSENGDPDRPASSNK